MARTEISVNTGIASGLNVTDNWTTGIADGHKVLNPNQNIIILVENNNVASKNVTFQTPQTIGDETLAVEEQIVAIGASKIHAFAGFSKKIYNQSDGMIYIDYEAATDAKVYPFTCPTHL